MSSYSGTIPEERDAVKTKLEVCKNYFLAAKSSRRGIHGDYSKSTIVTPAQLAGISPSRDSTDMINAACVRTGAGDGAIISAAAKLLRNPLGNRRLISRPLDRLPAGALGLTSPVGRRTMRHPGLPRPGCFSLCGLRQWTHAVIGTLPLTLPSARMFNAGGKGWHRAEGWVRRFARQRRHNCAQVLVLRWPQSTVGRRKAGGGKAQWRS